MACVPWWPGSRISPAPPESPVPPDLQAGFRTRRSAHSLWSMTPAGVAYRRNPRIIPAFLRPRGDGADPRPFCATDTGAFDARTTDPLYHQTGRGTEKPDRCHCEP